MKRIWEILIVCVCAVAVGVAVIIARTRVERMQQELDRHKGNAAALLSDVQRYRVRDSLNAARVESLQLTVKEYERFRADDAQLIRELKARNRDLSAVNKTQSETIIDLLATARDTVVLVRDSIVTPAVAVHCGDAWFDFDGLLTAGQFTGTLKNRDSLILAESVKYRRFLGFLWKTRKVEDRQLDVVSRNPHTNIVNIEHVVIER
jgi:hypothetical protein